MEQGRQRNSGQRRVLRRWRDLQGSRSPPPPHNPLMRMSTLGRHGNPTGRITGGKRFFRSLLDDIDLVSRSFLALPLGLQPEFHTVALWFPGTFPAVVRNRRLRLLNTFSHVLRFFGQIDRADGWQALANNGFDGMEKLRGRPSDNAVRSVCARVTDERRRASLERMRDTDFVELHPGRVEERGPGRRA